MSVQILVGDALTVLRGLPSESVQCVVTSPPYFNLRAYGTAPQIWGGDSEHDHDFHERRYYSERTVSSLTSEAFSEAGPDNAKRLQQARWKQDATCSCGAWRGELGLEPSPALFIEHLVTIFREVKRVLRSDGLAFVNLADSYSGSGRGPTGHNGIGDQGQRQGFTGVAPSPGAPAKNLLLIPQRFAIAMQDDGWIVRSCIVWAKTSAMPESVRDRPTSAWEPIWMFAKSQRYFWDQEAVRQPALLTGGGTVPTPDKAARAGITSNGTGLTTLRSKEIEGANIRNVWTLGPEPLRDSHYASFPSEIPRRCIKAGTSEKGACAACGAPWVRVIERTAGRWTPAAGEQRVLATGGAITGGTARCTQGATGEVRRELIGWAPSCSCETTETRPCVVLDPFLGSGTTALVADRLGRDAIGIELNPEYADMARRRIDNDAGPLLADPVQVVAARQPSMFDAPAIFDAMEAAFIARKATP